MTHTPSLFAFVQITLTFTSRWTQTVLVAVTSQTTASVTSGRRPGPRGVWRRESTSMRWKWRRTSKWTCPKRRNTLMPSGVCLSACVCLCDRVRACVCVSRVPARARFRSRYCWRAYLRHLSYTSIVFLICMLSFQNWLVVRPGWSRPWGGRQLLWLWWNWKDLNGKQVLQLWWGLRPWWCHRMLHRKYNYFR